MLDDVSATIRDGATALTPDFESQRGDLADRVGAVADRYPLYAHLGATASV